MKAYDEALRAESSLSLQKSLADCNKDLSDLEKRIKLLGEGKGSADTLLGAISKAVNPNDEPKQKKLNDIGTALTGLGKDVGKEDAEIKGARDAIQKLEQRIKEKPLNLITVEEIQ